jgi:photosystem II stability/assembly factor-like uncharacterized protein
MILHTTDGGANWNQQTTSVSSRFDDVFFIDQSHGCIVGIYGDIVLTTNGGTTWQEIPSGTSESLISVQFVDQNNGWIAGDAGTILRTRDGGFTWEEQWSGVATNTLTSICFVDTMNGWASGDGGTILHTTDGGGIVSVELSETMTSLPESFLLYQNYPNPFNPSTKIKFTIPSVGTSFMKFVQLKVYDVLGNEIATLVDEELTAGEYEVTFDAASSIENPASGIYFYQLLVSALQSKDGKAGSFIETKKMILLR